MTQILILGNKILMATKTLSRQHDSSDISACICLLSIILINIVTNINTRWHSMVVTEMLLEIDGGLLKFDLIVRFISSLHFCLYTKHGAVCVHVVSFY